MSRLILMNDLKLSKVSSTRAIAALTSYGILRLCLPLPRPTGKKGGPKVRVYETPDSEPEQVVKVAEYHRRLESPRYMYAVRMAQSMLEDYAREAGARSFDMRMPEEVNRSLTDTAPTCSSRFKSCVPGS